MSFPRYPSYKPSGVEWLGEVPAHWEIWKLAHAFTTIGSGTTPKSDVHEYYDEGEIPWLNTGDLCDWELESCEKRVTTLALKDHSSLKIYPAGSVVIAMYGATIGKLGMLRFPATVNQACCVFGGLSEIEPAFMFYWFLGLRERVVSLATGGGQPNISQDILRGLRLACPLAFEQTRIAEFLDRETAKIDELVTEQRRLMELLKEKRQAVISHAVTRGVNPKAPACAAEQSGAAGRPLKPSGIEWLGDVPAHWEVGPLKRYWSVTDCKHVTAEFVEDGIPLASIREVQSRWVTLENAKRTTEYFYKQLIEGGREPLPGDLIFSRNATVGEVAQVSAEHPKFAMGQDVVLLRKLSPKYSSDFLQHVIRSPIIIRQLDNMMIGSTFKRINVEEIRSFMVPFPPSTEQEKISFYLESEVAKFDTLTAEAQRAIDLLQERRTALISAAVTGQIDVRNV